MKIVKEKYCIASKVFPLIFYEEGEDYDDIEEVCLREKEKCENDLNTYYDFPEELQVLKVKVTYEI